MTAPGPTVVRSGVVAGLRPALAGRVRTATGDGAVGWSVHASLAELRGAVVRGAVDRAPDVLVLGYARRHAWSVRTLLSLVLGLPGARDTRVLLVTGGPRSALPVWLTDEPRLEVVAPAEVGRPGVGALASTAPGGLA